VPRSGASGGVCRDNCLCLCCTVHAEGTDVEAAYFGELGYELQLYTPYIYNLHTLGSLKKTLVPMAQQPTTTSPQIIQKQSQDVTTARAHMCITTLITCLSTFATGSHHHTSSSTRMICGL